MSEIFERASDKASAALTRVGLTIVGLIILSLTQAFAHEFPDTVPKRNKLMYSRTWLAAQSFPRFEDYEVSVYTGTIHRPQWIHRVNADEWRDKIGKLVEPPEVNFAGKYFVSVHSCGSGCRYYTMTDLSSGRELNILDDFGAAEPPPKTLEGYPYFTDLVTRANSKLLVAQYRIDSPRGEECRERAFIFDDDKLAPITGTGRNCRQLIASLDSFPTPSAQTSPAAQHSGTLEGTILDENGERVLATRIVIEGNRRERDEGYTEDATYRLDLPAGIYFISFRADGFYAIRRKRIRVVAGSTRTLNITLRRLRSRQG